MDRYAVIGHPVAHSKSPRIHQFFAQQTAQQLSYEALLSPLADFAGTWATFREEGGRGANVTVPFKEQAWRLCQQRSARAELAGAVNTLVVTNEGMLLGDNTDGVGLVRDITDNAGWALVGQRVLLLGAGGAARGVIGPLLAAGVAQILVANRTLEKAHELVTVFNRGPESRVGAIALAALVEPVHAESSSQVTREPFDLIINATSASLQGEQLNIDTTWYHANSAVYDLMYGTETTMMTWARERGLVRRRDGLGMLIEQAAEAFYLWRQVRPNTQELLANW